MPASRIVPYVDIGDMRDAQRMEGGYDVVVNCTRDIQFTRGPREYSAIRVPVDDDGNERAWHHTLVATVPAVVDHMDGWVKQRKRILVHCAAGMQRSPMVVACYLMSRYSITPDQAVNFIREKRPIAFTPAVNFRGFLKLFYVARLSGIPALPPPP